MHVCCPPGQHRSHTNMQDALAPCKLCRGNMQARQLCVLAHCLHLGADSQRPEPQDGSIADTTACSPQQMLTTPCGQALHPKSDSFRTGREQPGCCDTSAAHHQLAAQHDLHTKAGGVHPVHASSEVSTADLPASQWLCDTSFLTARRACKC